MISRRQSGCFLPRVAALLFLAGSLSCARTPASRLMLPPPSDPWTRPVSIYDALDLNLYGHVTFRAWDVRRRMLEQQARDFHLDTAELQAREKAEREDWTTHADFFLAAFTPKRAWNDFDRNDSRWKVYLSGEGSERLQPESIRQASGQDAPDATQAGSTAWSETYMIRFRRPAGSDGQPLEDSAMAARYRLAITGPLGEAEIRW